MLTDQDEHEGLGEEAADPLSLFLIKCSSPPPTVVLPTPSTDGGGNAKGQAEKPTKRSSGRLAAKPKVGWSMMYMVQLVLLKKSYI